MVFAKLFLKKKMMTEEKYQPEPTRRIDSMASFRIIRNQKNLLRKNDF